MKQIFLIRHTTPDVEKGTCYGQTDLGVVETFAQEVAEVQAVLPTFADMQVYSSPLRRCRLLAEKLQTTADLRQIDNRLMEMHFGEWEMQKWADIQPEMLRTWKQNFVEIPAPAGESHGGVFARSMDFWHEKMALPHENFAVVTHYGVIQCLLAHLLHIPLHKLFKIDLGYGAVVRVLVGEDDYCKVKFLR
jgi:alpha-ribazole phosphatase